MQPVQEVGKVAREPQGNHKAETEYTCHVTHSFPQVRDADESKNVYVGGYKNQGQKGWDRKFEFTVYS